MGMRVRYADYLDLLSAASLHEAAGRIGALPSRIRPLDLSMRLCGPAYPVRCGAGSNIALHHAICQASHGDVLVVETGDGEFGYWGEILNVAAEQKGLSGLVIAGGVRDAGILRAMRMPVFAETVCLRGAGKGGRDCALGKDIFIGDVRVQRGDLVFGDADGVVIVPGDVAQVAIDASIARDEQEARYKERIKSGVTTIEIYGFAEALNAGARVHKAAPLRRSVQVRGLGHGDLPIPAASRIGDIVATGGIRGVDKQTGEIPVSFAEQAELMFSNLKTILEGAGCGLDDVVKLTVWMCDAADRAALNPPWLKAFPNPESRPSRHVLIHSLPGAMRVQCEALAVCSDKPREAKDV
jgi:4-hydroxy-4-methyl-2-oxoglutarate aldolase